MISEEGIEKALDDIEYLKKELKELKTDHVAVVRQLKKELLNLQCIMAGFKINSDADTFCIIIDRQFPQKHSLRTQVLTDAASAKAKLTSFAKPMNLAVEFFNKWSKTLDDMGADTINY